MLVIMLLENAGAAALGWHSGQRRYLILASSLKIALQSLSRLSSAPCGVPLPATTYSCTRFCICCSSCAYVGSAQKSITIFIESANTGAYDVLFKKPGAPVTALAVEKPPISHHF